MIHGCDPTALRRLMFERNLSEPELAELAGVSGKTVYNALQGKRLRGVTIARIRAALKEAPVDDAPMFVQP